jgi:fluoroacetyl-CoA thioesterase
MKFFEFSVGMTKAIQKTVTEEDTAHYYGSGALEDLLATPTLTAYMIEASVMLIDSLLPEGYISIGRRLSIEHLMPTVKGMTVTVESKISNIEGNKINIDITAYDELGVIGRGQHERYIVKHDILMGRVQNRCGLLNPTP